MSLYFNAFVGTALIMFMVGVLAEVVTIGTLSLFHASRSVLLTGEAITAIGVLIAAVFFYRMTLATERRIANEGQ